ncbi:MAG: peptide chain release factor N(5)-glutamine methyltransferase [Deltaproteobacteria bacterium HGW-Deltaproteobacteria-17]|nr:MAG: peptide chain release factor N(5)-glutamine methyltransferase [Deltaproteobacteria bacterium HGW-Deltaproteobacteria-17]
MTDDAASRTWTVRDVVRWMTQRFTEEKLDSPRLDADLLCAHLLGCDRVGIYLAMDRPLSASERENLRALVRRRLAREPVAYLTGRKEFFGLTFTVTPEVLIPRPDTETLVEAALELTGPVRADTALRLLDIGCGSGAIAISLAHARPAWRVTATDLSTKALAVARENALRLKAEVEFLEGSLLAPVAGRRFDVIASNPPYIPRNTVLQPEIRHEPPGALFADDDGLALLKEILSAAPAHLEPGGHLLLEFGQGQDALLTDFAAGTGAYAEIRVLRDLAGAPRVLHARQ